MTHLLLLGASHHSTPIDLRERLDFGTDTSADALAAMVEHADIGEAVVLSTCNRSETYVTCADVSQARQHLLDLMTVHHQVPLETLEPHLYSKVDGEVARHLFRVAAGLDSLVVGEPQILGQVKAAHGLATDQHCTGPLLNRLFHSSFAVGKRVRAETGLAEGAVSIGYAAVSLARKIHGDLSQLRVLLLGAGEMAKLTATHLRSQQVQQIVVVSRTPAHADALAREIDGKALPWSQRLAVLAESDIVITATGSPDPILTRADITDSLHAGRSRPLFIIDIAVPRDVDPEAAQLEQVFLYNIDDLKAIVRTNLARRTAEIERAESIVGSEVEQYETWLRSRRAIPTVVALRQRFEAIRRSELERLGPKIAGLPPEARARIEEITRLIVEKLLLKIGRAHV